MSKPTVNKVSIWLESDGHTFSNGTEAEGGDVREIVVNTFKTALVPEQYLDTNDSSRHLRDIGLSVAMDEHAVCSAPTGGIVAVMAIGSDTLATLREQYPHATFTSPLLLGEPMEQGTLLELRAKTLFVRIYDNGLRFAEAINIESEGDILFTLESLHRTYGFYNMNARAKGDTEALLRLTKGCFRVLEIDTSSEA